MAIVLLPALPSNARTFVGDIGTSPPCKISTATLVWLSLPVNSSHVVREPLLGLCMEMTKLTEETSILSTNVTLK